MSNKRPDDNKDDSSLWQRFTRNIKPLHQSNSAPKDTKKTADVKNSSRQKSNHTPTVTHPIPSEQPQVNRTPENSLDRRTLQKLKQGKMPVEGVLDMHGMRQDEAHSRLITFITHAHLSQKRCVLIITGKGSRSDNNIGVLKSRLPDWIKIAPLDTMILTHVSAHRKHGGEGAFYLYLKRQR